MFQLEQDLEGLFDVNDFAVNCWTASGGNFKGVLDREYIETEQVTGEHPVLTTKHANIADYGLAVGSVLNIETYDRDQRRTTTTAYTIRVFQPDMWGIIDLVLSEN